MIRSLALATSLLLALHIPSQSSEPVHPAPVPPTPQFVDGWLWFLDDCTKLRDQAAIGKQLSEEQQELFVKCVIDPPPPAPLPSEKFLGVGFLGLALLLLALSLIFTV